MFMHIPQWKVVIRRKQGDTIELAVNEPELEALAKILIWNKLNFSMEQKLDPIQQLQAAGIERDSG